MAPHHFRIHKNSPGLNDPPGRFNTTGEYKRDFHSYIPYSSSPLAEVHFPPPSPPPAVIATAQPGVRLPSCGDAADLESDQFETLVRATQDMSLPGLGIDDEPEYGGTATASFGRNVITTTSQSQTQIYNLQQGNEWRFETALGRSITVKITSGQAELFGTELVIGHTYTFTSTKAAVFTWRGCVLDVTSDYGPLHSALTSEYVAEETPAHEYLNIETSLEAARETATNNGKEGPRVLILGPDSSGKSSLAKTTTAWGIRRGRSPVVVNIDPSEGVLSLPGTMTATVFKTMLEVEEGWGNAPMSGPNGEIPVKLPLVYYYGSMIPDEKGGTIYKSQIKRLALAVAGKTAFDPETKASGIVIDTPGTLVNARAAGAGYDIVTHIVSEFGINRIVCLGSERLYSDMVRKFDNSVSSRSTFNTVPGSEPERVHVIKVTKSGGVAERDATYMRAVRDAQVKLYFYGSQDIDAGIALQPRQQQVDFDTLTVWRRISSVGPATSMASGNVTSIDDEDSFLPGGADDSETAPTASAVPLPASQVFERLTSPVPALRNCVLAVMNCEPEPEGATQQEVLRDSSVMGFLYVTDIEEARGRISLLSPVAGRVPHRALVWGEGVEGVLGLT